MVQGEEFEEGLERGGEGRPDGRVVRAEGEGAGHDVRGHHVKEGKDTRRGRDVINGRRAGFEIGDQVAEGGVEIGDR